MVGKTKRVFSFSLFSFSILSSFSCSLRHLSTILQHLRRQRWFVLRLVFVDRLKIGIDGLFFVFSSSSLGQLMEDESWWFVLTLLFVDGLFEAEFVDWWKIRVMHEERISWDLTITRRIKSSSIKVKFFLLFLCSIVFKVDSFLLGPMNIIDLISFSSLWINTFGLV